MSDLEKIAQRYPLTTLFITALVLVFVIYFGGMGLLSWLRH